METLMCKCGKHPATYNSITGSWELCSVCKGKLSQSNIMQEIESMFGRKYRNASISDYKPSVTHSLHEDVLDTVSNNLLLTGASSTGKTYLMAAMCSEMLLSGKVYTCEYVNTIQLYCEIGADITQFERMVNAYTDCDVLFLDEYVNPKTVWEERLLYLILENRKNDMKVTVSASNLDPKEINGRFLSRLLENNGVHYVITRECWNGK